MEKFGFARPRASQVRVNDAFWTPYLDMLRSTTLNAVFDRFEAHGYFANFDAVAAGAKNVGHHDGPPFSDGLVFETMRGAYDFLADKYDAALDSRLDGYVSRICAAAAADKDGYLCTNTTMLFAEHRWGQNGGNIVYQHDLYDAGCLVEAAIASYTATGRTKLLAAAVRYASYMCRCIGAAPKLNIVPGHGLPEEAFVKLYRLLRDTPSLSAFKRENAIDEREYLRLAEFWVGARGHYEGRVNTPPSNGEYSQDHALFETQRTAVGHAVRAMLFYTGASAATYENGRGDWLTSLEAIWNDVVSSKLHVSGGIGTRRDIEGFAGSYELPNDAYLETCAGAALMFWAGEMNLLTGDPACFDVYERTLYNNVMAAVSDDGLKFFYENPLVSPGGIERWEWHGCPCCPPMLMKAFSSLKTYIYSLSGDCLRVNLYIGSEIDTGDVRVIQKDGVLQVQNCPDGYRIELRCPEYWADAAFSLNGQPVSAISYGAYTSVSVKPGDTIEITKSEPIRLTFASPNVKYDAGLTAVRRGPCVYCAEEADDPDLDALKLPAHPKLTLRGGKIAGTAEDGKPFELIPYRRWANRGAGKMKVWLPIGQTRYKGDKLYYEENCDE